MSRKVIVIGLDGGTFKLIKPFVAKGLLPNLAKLMSRGGSRVLKSTVPPVSPPAWTTFLTGTNPGGHGIFQFVDMDVAEYSFSRNRLINSALYAGNTFIDFIGNRGLKVGVVKIPFTYPPWPVNGVMVAGEPSPDWEKAHTYPPELADEIGRVNMGSAADFMRYNTQDLLEHLKFDCRRRTQITEQLMQANDYDFLMMVHNITDAAIHRFWKFTDESCPNYKKSYRKHKDIIQEVYEAADESIGQILNHVDDDTTVFIMSDHGAARKSLYYFHLNAWLKQTGYLCTHESKSYAQYLYGLLAWLQNKIPPLVRQIIMRLLREHFRERLSRFKTKAANFQWDRTKAYAVNLYNNFDGIAVNLKGRQPNGCVAPGPDVETLCDEIMKALPQVRNPFTHAKIVKGIYRRNEVFSGAFADKMPELIVEYELDYRSGNRTGPSLVSNVPKTDFDFQSGDHDPDGIFIAAGPHIQPNTQWAPRPIQNMAPTILHAMGLPVPSRMDGRVMTDIFEPSFIQKNPVLYVTEQSDTTNQDTTLSPAEEDEMKKQLQGLGYM